MLEEWLRDLPIGAVHELPRAEPEAGPDAGREQRLAALVAAYHAGGGVLVGWARRRPAGPVEVLVGGASLLGERSGEEMLLASPAGARARPRDAHQLLRGWRAVPAWTRLAGIADVLAQEEREGAEQTLHPSLEQRLLAVWREPFHWLLLALPLPRAELEQRIRQAAQDHRQARSRAAASQDQAVEAERLEARHRELRQAVSTGLWRLHLLAGAGSPEAARRLSGLLAAALDTSRLPYVLTPSDHVDAFDAVLARDQAPLEASSHLLAALARMPEEEVPGIRLALRPRFDVTPEPPAEAGEEAIELGRVLDGGGFDAGPFHLGLANLNRHTFVSGATGAGKSQTVRALLEQLSRLRIPWLVVEPAKAEYRLMAARLAGAGEAGEAEVIAIRPGDVDAVPAGLNPLKPEPGFPLQTHVDLVRSLFLAAFEAEEPFPQVLGAALTRCYEELGWDLTLGEPRLPGRRPRLPTLSDLQRCARSVVQDVGYGPEVTQNVRGFIEVRLSSLRAGTPGRFFEGGHPIDVGRLLAGRVVLEIEDVGDDRDKAFLMGTVLLRLVEHLRVRQRREAADGAGAGAGPARLRHVSVFEEAHRLLRHSPLPGPAAHAVELFAGLLAEIRAYGEGLVVAEQIPGKLLPDVIKNTAVKIVHRLPALDDREAVGATMNVTERQSDYLVTLAPGEAAAFRDGMDYPVLVRMPDGTERERRGGAAPRAGAVAALVGRCTSACGADCRQAPCTLRQMREAQQLLHASPGLVLWAELAVLAHLMGLDAVRLRPEFRRDLAAVARRRRDCAIAHAVDAAVASRAGVLIAWMSPDDLVDHVAAALRADVQGAGTGCAWPEPRWIAPAYRWRPLLRALETRLRADPAAGPHPDTASWERLYDRPIPGATGRDQRDAVLAWDRAASEPDPTRHDTLSFGAAQPSAMEAAAGASRADPDWQRRLRRVVDTFALPREWPATPREAPYAGGGR